MNSDMLPGLDLYNTDPAELRIPAGEDLGDLDYFDGDRSVPGGGLFTA